ncbi:bifunctional proline dehydrogenase/L-glutamate gamma-semialdehyde dehydrogenase PutA [Gluconobacter wancherniae]|uniref:bifunctional proline dehydrogenase/L-glutamate gamma-semialdehyde dehydrogenase PutA n=1 Tax=Gluconobacter wancherniae TaxID=1307955 RepID=UPI0030ADFDB1
MTQPFSTLQTAVPARSSLRQTITANTRVPEASRVAALALEATLPAESVRNVKNTARHLVKSLRTAGDTGLVQGLVREYDLSTQEGIALMCLAEALLRIPDIATRDALIRDKIGGANWREHLGADSTFFVNAATWGLVFSGRLLSSHEMDGVSGALTGLLARCGEPLIRRGVDMAMRLMGEQFVTGQTIEHALKNSRKFNEKGFRYSYDMLGEAATTAEDAERYYRDYEQAIHAIGKASAGQGVYRGPGISVKLSALHPRYSRLQRARALEELLPRVAELARLACGYDIGFNIDAEETDRLELSLDLLEALCFDEALRGWKGIGFVVQAYQKRAPFVLDWVIDLARRSDHRLMVRLVKGAYWDSEIKRAQTDGLSDFPVFTVKNHTDISYIACARKLLSVPQQIFPQFATHNAQTLATIYTIAGPDFTDESYEFQCLHGMGEALYQEVVGPEKMNRPVRVYAPVGTHETLLAYLVRRLLENGANSSFVNRIQDENVSVDTLIEDPVMLTGDCAGNPSISLPGNLYQPERANSQGLDLADEATLHALADVLSAARTWGGEGDHAVLNPANLQDVVGHIVFASAESVAEAISTAEIASTEWGALSADQRALCLEKAADVLEGEMQPLMGLIIREAGKSYVNAVAEIREAVDFLRYYAARSREVFSEPTSKPLGVVACISPWNFPLAIFLGQVAAALAAGNVVLAKPAEETPLIAQEAVRILHEAGVPEFAVQLVAGAGDVGAQLVRDPRVAGVLFTGSTEVARLIQKQLADRLNPDGTPVPLIAETGGQNALIVDSSALSEQVVADTLSSAFDSAGQRCSALRLLCLQEESADRVLTMLKGAMTELSTGNPQLLSTDIGPVISSEAQAGILRHIEEMRAKGYRVYQAPLSAGCEEGMFVPPTLIEIPSIAVLKREIFGPVLHVVRYPRAGLDRLMDDINATGYALTFGVHTRIDRTIARVTERTHAGNVYVNRNLVGAVVGVQPFGGHGLSGTGPKAGGPIYLRRLLAVSPLLPMSLRQPLPSIMSIYTAWMREREVRPSAPALTSTPLGTELTLPGPVGEKNLYSLLPRGNVLCAGGSAASLLSQAAAALATGNRVLVLPEMFDAFPNLPAPLSEWIRPFDLADHIDVALCSHDAPDLLALGKVLAKRTGQIVTLHTNDDDGSYRLEALVLERCVSTNTTAAGGNAALMMVS